MIGSQRALDKVSWARGGVIVARLSVFLNKSLHTRKPIMGGGNGTAGAATHILARRDICDTAPVRRRLEACFANPPPRDVYPIFGRLGVIRRDALWFGRHTEDGFFPLYRTHKTAYGKPTTMCGVKDAARVLPMPTWLVSLLDALSARHGLPVLNHAVLHRYVNGDDTIGQHHDKPMDLHPESTIVSVSIGATRAFKLGSETFDVCDGDTLMIPFATNLAVKHGIPKRKRSAGIRYSITARTVRTFTNRVDVRHL